MDVLAIALIVIAVMLVFIYFISSYFSRVLKIPLFLVFLVILFTGPFGIIIFLVMTIYSTTNERNAKITRKIKYTPKKSGKK